MLRPFSPLDAFFGVSARGSTVRRELLAGLTSFISISYILVVVSCGGQ